MAVAIIGQAERGGGRVRDRQIKKRERTSRRKGRGEMREKRRK